MAFNNNMLREVMRQRQTQRWWDKARPGSSFGSRRIQPTQVMRRTQQMGQQRGTSMASNNGMFTVQPTGGVGMSSSTMGGRVPWQKGKALEDYIMKKLRDRDNEEFYKNSPMFGGRSKGITLPGPDPSGMHDPTGTDNPRQLQDYGDGAWDEFEQYREIQYLILCHKTNPE